MSLPRYPEYKDSGVAWLGEVPGHWEVRAIKHIVSTPITDGPHETPNFPDEGVPFVSAEAVSSGVIDFSKIRGFISEADHLRYSEKYRPQRGDIYMVKSGATTGVTAIVETDTEFSIWSPLAVIRCGEQALPRFVLNFMRSRNFLEAVTLSWSFGTQQNIGMGVIENLAVTIPPREEQQTIAAFLDRETGKIDALIAEQQRLVELLAEKRQAVISHAVTKGLPSTGSGLNAKMKDSGIAWLGEVPEHWGVKRVRFVAELNPSKSEVAALDKEMLVSFLPMDAIGGDGTLNLEREKPIAEVGAGYTYFRDGDVTIAKITPCFENGKGAVMRGLTQGIGFGTTELIVARPLINQTNSEYLHFIFISNVFRKNGEGHMYGAGGQKRVPDDFLRNFEIAFPPIKEQQIITTFLNTETAKFDALTAEANRAIELLKERRSALVSAAVTGKIDVREAA